MLIWITILTLQIRNPGSSMGVISCFGQGGLCSLSHLDVVECSYNAAVLQITVVSFENLIGGNVLC